MKPAPPVTTQSMDAGGYVPRAWEASLVGRWHLAGVLSSDFVAFATFLTFVH
jgi:hypothetical protein